MRLLHRLSRYPDLTGVGGEMHAGRWNWGRRRVVYLSSSCALALTEILVTFVIKPETMPDDFRHVMVEVTDDVWNGREVIEAEQLPDGWNSPLHGDGTRSLGESWLASGRSALLEVPSAIVPRETNVLLNPHHPDAEGCTIVSAEPFEFDERLLR